ncbi:MAG: molybdopterin molybdenumtransferase MoeA, partial [Gammaproteobacteria bacterium]
MTAADTLNAADACGRVLADDVSAPIDLPPFESSAMDGYAYPAAGIGDGDRLSIVGESLAG